MFLRYFLVLLMLAGAVAGLAWLKYGQIQRDIALFSQPMPAPVVDAVEVTERAFEPSLSAVGTVSPVQGVMVANEVAGVVRELRFESGDRVQAGQVLAQLDDSVDQADLAGLLAAEKLAEIQLERNTKLLKDRAVSRGDVDQATAELDQARALVAAKRATIEKKTVRAPFAGQLGIREANLGQFLPEGTPIVPLQSLDPVYVDFSLPERHLSELRPGQAVRVRVASYPDRDFPGDIRAVSPALDQGTRSVRLRAGLDNRDLLLRPGMFARVSVALPARPSVLTLPREAITYNTYGDSVFLIVEQEGKPVAQRRQVRTGDVIEDQVVIEDGLALGDRVVVAGQVKLRNDQEVQIREAAPGEAGPVAGEAAGTDPGASAEARDDVPGRL
jgi:membrane fusion protein (multidrug efflux system)